MGAALTYARRYALFTLVGIAGEDDLDAPDLATPTQKNPGPQQPVGSGNGRLNSGQHNPALRAGIQRKGNVRSNSAELTLGPEASTELRDRLLGEVNDLSSGDEAALWAHRHLSEKSTLNVADAERVEEAFRAKLATFAPSATDVPVTAEKTEQTHTVRIERSRRSGHGRRSSIRLCLPYRSRAGFGIGTTSSSWPSGLA